MPNTTYRTLEEIQKRKDELQADIRQESSQIGTLWHSLFDPKKANTKGELVTNLVSNSITAIDGFLLVRKLIKTYGHLFSKRKR
jgi:hypothetical protein